MSDFKQQLACATIVHQPSAYGNNVKLEFHNTQEGGINGVYYDLVTVSIPNFLKRDNLSAEAMNRIMEKLSKAIIDELE